MPRQEANLYGRPDSVCNAYPDSRQRPLTDAQMVEVNKVLREQTPVRTTELEFAGTVYPTAWMKRDDSSCREGSATESELRAIFQDTPTVTRERRVLQYNDKDDDELDMQHWRERTEADAKAGATRHPSRQLNGTAKRAGNPADAKVGSTQHPSLKNSVSYRSNLNKLPSCRRISCLSNGQSPEKSRTTKRRTQQKRRQDKAECRRAKKQNRRLGNQPITKVLSDHTAAKVTDTTKEEPPRMTNREALDRINSICDDCRTKATKGHVRSGYEEAVRTSKNLMR